MVRDFQAILPDIYGIRENLKAIKSKTLILGGNLDSIDLPEQQELMNRRIPNSNLIMLEDSHSLHIKSIIAFGIIT